MGTFRSTFKPQYSAALADRAHAAPATVKAKSLESALKVEPVAVTKPATVEQVQAEPKHTKTQAQRGGLVRGSVKADAGRIGGESTSPAKTAAAKVNGARGGRPRKAVAS